jgi:hypothetical protein
MSETPDDRLKRVDDQIEEIRNRFRPVPASSADIPGLQGKGAPSLSEADVKRLQEEEREKQRKPGESEAEWQKRRECIMLSHMSTKDQMEYFAEKQKIALAQQKTKQGLGSIVAVAPGTNEFGASIMEATIKFAPFVSPTGELTPNDTGEIKLDLRRVFVTHPELTQAQVDHLQAEGKEVPKPKSYEGTDAVGLTGKLFYTCSNGRDKTWGFLLS